MKVKVNDEKDNVEVNLGCGLIGLGCIFIGLGLLLMPIVLLVSLFK